MDNSVAGAGPGIGPLVDFLWLLTRYLIPHAGY
jgi:hypothetical protein